MTMFQEDERDFITKIGDNIELIVKHKYLESLFTENAPTNSNSSGGFAGVDKPFRKKKKLLKRKAMKC
jgi:hypothetical protein